jgi:hypothetical protein
LLKTLGNVFAIGYYRDEKLLHIYVKTIATENALRQYFDIKPSEFPTNFRYFAIAKLKRERDFYEIHEFNDIQSFLSVLEQGQGMLVWFALEPVLKELHYSRINKLQQLAQEGSEKHKQIIQLIRDKVKEPLYLVKLILLDNERKRLKLTAKQLEAYSSLGLSWEIPFFGVKPNNITKIINTQPKLNYLYALLNEKKWIHVTRSNIDQLLIIPNPSVLPTGIGKGAPLPTIIPERHGFRVGVNQETGREVQLELEDLQRHMYVIGGTGAGKTSFLATLITRFMKTYPENVVVLIDPNGDFAEQLASEMADYEKLIYVDPVQATIAVNPLSIPDGIPREQAELLAESNIKEIFEQLFALKAGAVYVEYVIINALKILYMKSRSPTFADLYNIIMKLRTGELDLPVSDPTWEEKLQQFQELEETTYISALSRLEEYATNPLLKKLFSSDSINDVLEPGNLIIVNASNAQIGTKASFLMIAGWVYKLWYSALIRAALRKKRIPVLTVIDEFEVVSDLSVLEIILSQARKFGMHLVLSHQHTDQVKNLLKSIFSNTAVKVLMRTAGDDAENLSGIDPAFSNEIKKILPKLEPGEAIMFMMPRKQGDPATPFKVKFDYTELKFDQEKLNTVIKRMREYYKVEEKKDDVTALVNPLFKYIEKPNVLEQQILYNIFVSRTENGNHSIYLVDLLKKLGVDRDRVENAINKLEAAGYISVEKVKNKKLLVYGKGLFGNIKAVAPSEEGRRLAMKVMIKYMRQGYYVAPAKQSPNLESRPDLVAIPIDRATLRPKYDRAIAIEIESCNEILTHPEQVVRNWRKESVKDFLEVHSWTYEECFDKLQQLYNQLSDAEKNKVKIFSIKLRKKVEQEASETKNKAEETGELTQKENKQKNEAQTIDVKPGSLTKIMLGNIEVLVIQEDGELSVIEFNGKKYVIKKKDLEDFIRRKDEIKTITLSRDILGIKLSAILADGGTLTALVKQI